MATLLDSQPGSKIASVPLEVLLKITSSLTTIDLGNVRLTCKFLERSLFNFFSHEFFRKKQFMLFEASLQALVDISRHAALRNRLNHVIITTDRIEAPTRARGTPSQRATRCLANADQIGLLHGGARYLLAEAFRNLPNLETVDIRDFNSQSRKRDGVQAFWRSYGAATLSAALGEDLTQQSLNSSSNTNHLSQVFCIVIAALAEANARPNNLEVLVRKTPGGLLDAFMYIPRHLDTPVASLLASLKTLHLCLYLQPRDSVVGGNQTHVEQWPFVKKFLTYAKNVTELRLNVFHLEPSSSDQELLGWVAGCDLHQDAQTQLEQPRLASIMQVDPPQFPFLGKLDIGFAIVPPNIFLSVIAKFALTLRALSIWKVMIWDKDNDVSDKVNLWAGIFAYLARHTNLREVHIGQLWHKVQAFSLRVSFSTQSPVRSGDVYVKSYSGSCAERFFESLARDVTVHFPGLDEDIVGEEGGEEEGEDFDENNI